MKRLSLAVLLAALVTLPASSAWADPYLSTPSGNPEPARSGDREVPSEIRHFGGRVTETGDGWFEARSWFGLGGRERFHTNADSKFYRHGEVRPFSDLKKGDYTGVWWTEDESGKRLVQRVQVGGRPGDRPRE